MAHRRGPCEFLWAVRPGRRRFTRESEGLYAEIRCPVRILWGEHDPWIPLERGRALYRLMPQAGFEILPGIGHLPQLEAPELVQAQLDDFLGVGG
jgi:pimeloyl-ACP methyl ester carboxylesterase